MKKFSNYYKYQKLSAKFLTILVPYILWFLYSHRFESFEYIKTSIKIPINSMAFFFCVLFGCYHGFLGVNSIITDYIHSKTLLKLLNILNKVFFMALFIMTVISLKKICFPCINGICR